MTKLPYITHCKRHNHRHAAPFTVMEIVVVTAITGVAIAAAVGLLTSVMWGTNYTRHRLTASNIANDRVELLRSIPYIDVPSMEEDRIIVNEQGVPDGNGAYKRTTIVGTDFLKTRQVTVTVQTKWKYDMPPLDTSVTTIVADQNLLKN